MTVREYMGWKAFAKLFPFGEDANDVRAAMICAVTANASPNRKRSKTYQPKNFLPFKRTHQPKPRSKEDLVKRIFAAFKLKKDKE